MTPNLFNSLNIYSTHGTRCSLVAKYLASATRLCSLLPMLLSVDVGLFLLLQLLQLKAATAGGVCVVTTSLQPQSLLIRKRCIEMGSLLVWGAMRVVVVQRKSLRIKALIERLLQGLLWPPFGIS